MFKQAVTSWQKNLSWGLEMRDALTYTRSMPSSVSSAKLARESLDAPCNYETFRQIHTSGRRAQVRNFFLLAIYQIMMRTGWIFKTESIIIPAVLDTISGAGWVRGWLPLLNRFGTGVTPLITARRIKNTPHKKWILLLMTGLMAATFSCLSFLFLLGFAKAGNWWMPLAFLCIYAVFFACLGVNNLTFNTLQGKLVRVNRRGRLLLFANVVGATSAVACALLLLPRWLERGSARFDLIFGFAGFVFACSAVTILFLVELADNYNEPAAPNSLAYFVDAYRIVSHNQSFRTLSFLAASFGASFMLFPHYQSVGLQGMRLELKSLMWWVVIQNIGTGVFSVPAGAIADRWGNRLVLKMTMLVLATGPILAILLLHAGEVGNRYFHVVFLIVGVTPVVVKTLQNYTLEICSPSEQPRYLSTLNLCIAMPVLFSPVVGGLIDLVGYEIVFLAITAVILCGWGLTHRLHEPRGS